MKRKNSHYLICAICCLFSLLVYSCKHKTASDGQQTSTEVWTSSDDADTISMADDEYAYVEPPLNSLTVAFIHELTKNICQDNRQAVARMIAYPLNQPYPLKNITNASELLKHYDRVFPRTLRAKLDTSRIEDWSQVGWRGVMFDCGDIWIDRYDVDTVLVRAVNSNIVANTLMTKEIEQARQVDRKIIGSPSHYIPYATYLTKDSMTLIHFAFDSIANKIYAILYHNQPKIDQHLHKNSKLQLECNYSVQGSCANEFYDAILGDDTIELWDLSCGSYDTMEKYAYGFQVKADTTSLEKNLLDTIGSVYNADVEIYGYYAMQPAYLPDIVK